MPICVLSGLRACAICTRTTTATAAAPTTRAPARASIFNSKAAWRWGRHFSRTSWRALSMATDSGPCKRSGTGGASGSEAQCDDDRVVVVWLRTDLRLHDNGSLAAAAELVASGKADSVLPVYCFDPVAFGSSLYGSCDSRTGPLRARFLLESVSELRRSLRSIGSDLAVKVGQPHHCIPAVMDRMRCKFVYAQCEITTEEQDEEAMVAKAVKSRGADLCLTWGPTVLHIDDLPFGEDMEEFPGTFTGFRREVEDTVGVRQMHPTPAHGDLPLPGGLEPALLGALPLLQELLPSAVELQQHREPSSSPGVDQQLGEHQASPENCFRAQGGESAALERLQYFFWETDLVANYFNTRNNLIGRNFSTKLSAWLAAGCLSPRLLYHELRRYEQERTENKSTYWITFELFTRDFFKFFAAKHGRRMFWKRGLMEDGYNLEWDERPELFERWKTGTTGLPLVDACMRELNTTGYMSNRGRQNVASYLIMDYGVDWRKGAEYFEARLVDYDPALNWGNWVAAAGLTVTRGGRVNRFNVVKQSRDYDPNGDFLRFWLPELANCPEAVIHEPWLMTDQQQEEHGVQIGVDYPQPIPDSDLPCARMKQVERIKQQRAEAKQAAAAARREEMRQLKQRGRSGQQLSEAWDEKKAKPRPKEQSNGSTKGSAADKYRYHDDPKDKMRPVGIQRPETE